MSTRPKVPYRHLRIVISFSPCDAATKRTKRWLQTEIPALYLRYGTVMRYKAHAAKLRQIMELADPIPVSRILQDAAPQDASRGGPQDTATPGAPERDYDAETEKLAGTALWWRMEGKRDGLRVGRAY